MPVITECEKKASKNIRVVATAAKTDARRKGKEEHKTYHF
jgi:hypothetical protein